MENGKIENGILFGILYSMRLLLTSSGITNKTIEDALIRLLDKPVKDCHITFVPTAANIEKGDKSWLVDDMHNIKAMGFSTFDIIDISAVGKDMWLPSFENADLLVFGGGNVSHLHQWIHTSGLDTILPDLLKTKVYMGISAGSMVTAKTITLSSAQLLYYENTGNKNEINGLGFVDFEIRPHLNSEWFPKVTIEHLEQLTKGLGHPVYALDDNTAVQVIDDEIRVVSTGTWKKFN